MNFRAADLACPFGYMLIQVSEKNSEVEGKLLLSLKDTAFLNSGLCLIFSGMAISLESIGKCS